MNEDQGASYSLQVRSWLTRSMHDKQAHLQQLQFKVLSGFDGNVLWFVLQSPLSLTVALNVFFKGVGYMVGRGTPRVTVLSYGGQTVIADVTDSKVFFMVFFFSFFFFLFFQAVFVSFL